jgi:hypothetical protein
LISGEASAKLEGVWPRLAAACPVLFLAVLPLDGVMSLLTAPEVLNREFLEIRCKILDLAAAFDRLTRAEGNVADDPRLARLHEALAAVQEMESDRAERVKMIFSRPYDANWQKTFKATV